MKVKTVYSTQKTVAEAVKELATQLEGFEAKLILAFASTSYDLKELSITLKQHFGNAKTFGCSTAGEITSGHMLHNSVVAMALSSSLVEDCEIGVVENVNTLSQSGIQSVFQHFEEHFKIKMSEMDFKKYIGIILNDGLSGAEEQIMEVIGDLTDVYFVGGSAGDDMKFTGTYLWNDGKIYTNASVLALIKITEESEFDIVKTQSFKTLNKKLVANEVNEEKREVLQFNNQPAALVYSEAVGTQPNQASQHFMDHPLGLMIKEQPFVRSPQRIDGNGVIFYCNILEGMDLEILEATNQIVNDTQRIVQETKARMGKIEGIINFNCILRYQELKKLGLTEVYGKIFNDIPTIGFNTYGEAYLGHMNQTATILFFK